MTSSAGTGTDRRRAVTSASSASLYVLTDPLRLEGSPR